MMYELTATQRIDTWVPVAFFVLVWSIMQWHNKLPATESISKFVAMINSRGGNIVILSVASIYFFKYSMYLFLHLLEMVKNNTITESNAFGLMAIQFVTTSAFGGAMGALLKTMTGESSTARSTDNPSNGNGGRSLVITPGIPNITLKDTKAVITEEPKAVVNTQVEPIKASPPNNYDPNHVFP
jgi:hypothetical protein